MAFTGCPRRLWALPLVACTCTAWPVVSCTLRSLRCCLGSTLWALLGPLLLLLLKALLLKSLPLPQALLLKSALVLLLLLLFVLMPGLKALLPRFHGSSLVRALLRGRLGPLLALTLRLLLRGLLAGGHCALLLGCLWPLP